MAKKKSRIETRTVLIFLIILAIIGAGYVIFINLPPSVEYITVEELNNNKENFIDTKQTVIGTFDIYNGEPELSALEKKAKEIEQIAHQLREMEGISKDKTEELKYIG